MAPIPDGIDRITAIDIGVVHESVCLVCVYMPARGTAEADVEFRKTQDELLGLIEKNRLTHRIILGGDFNASLHRSETVKRDNIIKSLWQNIGNYPVNTTYMHEGTGASSKIEYWFLGEKNDEKVAIASPDPLNGENATLISTGTYWN